MIYGKQVIEEPHLVRIVSRVRRDETRRDGASDFGDSQRKKFLREINTVVRGSEHNILHMSFI